MKNKGTSVCLMTAHGQLPQCVDGKEHQYSNIKCPENNQSGFHTDECIHCGLRTEYDTSD